MLKLPVGTDVHASRENRFLDPAQVDTSALETLSEAVYIFLSAQII